MALREGANRFFVDETVQQLIRAFVPSAHKLVSFEGNFSIAIKLTL
jgi:hypothetical protein